MEKKSSSQASSAVSVLQETRSRAFPSRAGMKGTKPIEDDNGKGAEGGDDDAGS